MCQAGKIPKYISSMYVLLIQPDKVGKLHAKPSLALLYLVIPKSTSTKKCNDMRPSSNMIIYGYSPPRQPGTR